jgi:DNA-directed RNA polymerase I, II, and III subunit RPABC2
MEHNKYLRARILSARAFEVAVDAPIHVKASGSERPLDIAIKEMAEKKIPLELYRDASEGHAKKEE